MSIQVVCTNGHVLKVRDDMAGKSGLCPSCKATVSVPQPARNEDFEDSVADMLAGPAARKPWPSASETSGALKNGGRDMLRGMGAMKSCFKCHREISTGIHICPYCHTYIAKLTDF